MKINAIQIQKLYAFTRQHYVEHYDLQTELVDHLANSIEELWQENPNLTFEEALQKEFKKFGVFGFMDVVEKRQTALSKKYNKLVLKNLKTFFTIPKIISTIFSIASVYVALKFWQKDYPIFQTTFVLLAIVFFFGIIFNFQKSKKQTRLSGKKWMFEELIFRFYGMSVYINLPIQLAIHLKGDNYANWLLVLISFFIVLLVLVAYIVLILIPSNADEYIKETYPEYKLFT